MSYSFKIKSLPPKMARVMITFDDQFLSQYTEAFPYMVSKNIPGTIFVCTGNINGFSYPDYPSMTNVQLKEIYDYGWTIGHHFRHHYVVGIDITTQADIEQEIQWAMDDLSLFGMTRDILFCATPGGGMTDNYITAAAVKGTKITRIVTANSGFYIYGVGRNYIPCKFVGSGVSLADSISWIDDAITNQYTCSIGIHNVVDPISGGNDWSLSDFKELIDYIAASNIDPITYSSFYDIWLKN